MPRRVVHVVQHLAPGGIESLVLELMRLAPPGHEVHVVSLEGRRRDAARAWPRLEPFLERLHFLDKPAGWRPGTVWRLHRLFKRLRPAAAHTHHIGPLLYGGLAARLAGVRTLIHTEHDAWHLRSPRRRAVQRLALGLVRPILVADAETVAQALGCAVPGAKPRVILNGVDTDRFSPGDRRAARARCALPIAPPMVGCAGRLEWVKGHDIVLQALALTAGDIHLALAGTGSCEGALRARARRLGLGDRVHFLGHLDDTADFYRALDLFCLPSRAEGLPLSLLEAQACDTPAIVSDVGGCREALCPDSGRHVPADDPDALAIAIEAQLRSSARRSPRAFVLEKGDARRMVRAYADLVERPEAS